MLLWSLGYVPTLPPADRQFEPIRLQDILPPYADVSISYFLTSASLRSNAELIQMADDCLNLHAEARIARQENRQPRWPIDAGVIQERHHAINWVIGYECLPWDDVTTDT